MCTGCRRRGRGARVERLRPRRGDVTAGGQMIWRAGLSMPVENQDRLCRALLKCRRAELFRERTILRLGLIKMIARKIRKPEPAA